MDIENKLCTLSKAYCTGSRTLSLISVSTPLTWGQMQNNLFYCFYLGFDLLRSFLNYFVVLFLWHQFWHIKKVQVPIWESSYYVISRWFKIKNHKLKYCEAQWILNSPSPCNVNAVQTRLTENLRNNTR